MTAPDYTPDYRPTHNNSTTHLGDVATFTHYVHDFGVSVVIKDARNFHIASVIADNADHLEALGLECLAAASEWRKAQQEKEG